MYPIIIHYLFKESGIYHILVARYLCRYFVYMYVLYMFKTCYKEPSIDDGLGQEQQLICSILLFCK